MVTVTRVQRSGGKVKITKTRNGRVVSQRTVSDRKNSKNLSKTHKSFFSPVSKRTKSVPRTSSSKSDSSTPIIVGVGKDASTGQAVVSNLGKDLSAEQRETVSDLSREQGRLIATRDEAGITFSSSKESSVAPVSNAYNVASGLPSPTSAFLREQELAKRENAPYKRFETRIDPTLIKNNDNLVGQTTTSYGGFKPSTDPQAEDRFAGFKDYEAEQFFKTSGIKKLDPPKIIPSIYATPKDEKGSRYERAVTDLKPFSRDIVLLKDKDGGLRTKNVGEVILTPVLGYAEFERGLLEGGASMVKGLTVELPETVLGTINMFTDQSFRQEGISSMGDYYLGKDASVGRGLGRIAFDVGTVVLAPEIIKAFKPKIKISSGKALVKEVFDESTGISKINYAQELTVSKKGLFTTTKIDDIKIMGSGEVTWTSSLNEKLPYGIFEQSGVIKSSKKGLINFQEVGAVSKVDDLSIFRSGLEIGDKNKFLIQGVSKDGLTSSALTKIDDLGNLKKTIGTETSYSKKILEITKPKTVEFQGLTIESLKDNVVISSFEQLSESKTFKPKTVELKINPYTKEVYDPKNVLSNFQSAGEKPLAIQKNKPSNKVFYLEDLETLTPIKNLPLKNTIFKVDAPVTTKLKPFPQDSIKTVRFSESPKFNQVSGSPTITILEEPLKVINRDTYNNFFSSSSSLKVKTLYPSKTRTLPMGLPLSFSNVNNVMNKNTLKQNTFLASKSSLSFDNLVKQKFDSRIKQSTSQDLIQDVISGNKLSSRQSVSQDLIREATIKPKFIPATMPKKISFPFSSIKKPVAPIVTPMLPRLPKRLKPSPQTYTAIVGRPRNVNYRKHDASTLKRVVSLAKRDVDNTLGASFKVYNKGKPLSKGVSKKLNSNYRLGKSDKNLFVEKSKHRLDSRTEINALLKARSMNATKNINSLINKGFSMRNVRTAIKKRGR